MQFQEEEKKKIAEEQRILQQKERENQQRQLEETQSRLQQKNPLENYRTNELEKISRGKDIATSILEEIRKNSKEIRQARFSDVITWYEYNEPKPTRLYSYVCQSVSEIALRWGNKLDLTSEEKEILHKYHYEIERRMFQPVIKLPEKIDGEDFSYITVKISRKNALDIITKPDVLMRNLASQLMNPSRCLKTYIKGSDYWIRFSSYESPFEPQKEFYQKQ
jgi:hypothetical protein